jgi:hypothetical protein
MKESSTASKPDTSQYAQYLWYEGSVDSLKSGKYSQEIVWCWTLEDGRVK